MSYFESTREDQVGRMRLWFHGGPLGRHRYIQAALYAWDGYMVEYLECSCGNRKEIHSGVLSDDLIDREWINNETNRILPHSIEKMRILKAERKTAERKEWERERQKEKDDKRIKNTLIIKRARQEAMESKKEFMEGKYDWRVYGGGS